MSDDDLMIFPLVDLGDSDSDGGEHESMEESPKESDEDSNHSDEDMDEVGMQYVSLQQRRMSKLGYIDLQPQFQQLQQMQRAPVLGLRRNSSQNTLSSHLGGLGGSKPPPAGGMRRNSSAIHLQSVAGMRRNNSQNNLMGMRRNSSAANLINTGMRRNVSAAQINNVVDTMIRESATDMKPEDRTMTLPKRRWVWAVKMIMDMKDPWEKFHLQDLDVEKVKRHRYNALKKKWTEEIMYVKIQAEAFNRGAMRACFRLISHPKWTKNQGEGTELKSKQKIRNYVAKKYMEDVEREVYFEDVRLQMDAKLWGEEYNRHRPPKKVDIFQMSVIEFVDREDQPLYHLENFIEGEYIKYNSNSGFVDENKRLTPQAFSHFTFERSGHQLIIVDVQGVGDLWTDPQIHTSEGTDYGSGNLGTRGMALFFHSHVCNQICHSLRLSVFDLSPTEHDISNMVRNVQGSMTIVRGCEEMVVSPSPTERVDLTSFLARSRQRTISRSSGVSDISERSTENDDDDVMHEPPPFFPKRQRSNDSFSNMVGSPDTGITADMVKHLNRVRFVSESERESDTSMDSGADTIGEEEERLLFQRLASKQHRPSCVTHEINARRLSSITVVNDSVLGQIHHDMAKYHEIGRFCMNDNDIDWEAALFHEQHAANLGTLEAINTLARLYLGMQTDVLVNCEVDKSDPQNIEEGVRYMQMAANHGDRAAMVYMAEAYASGNNLGKLRSKSYADSVHWYEKAVGKAEEEDDGGEFDGTMHTPVYAMKAKMAEMYLEGDDDLEKDPSWAGDLYNEAAEAAMAAMKGRMANKYYALAEEAYAQVEE